MKPVLAEVNLCSEESARQLSETPWKEMRAGTEVI